MALLGKKLGICLTLGETAKYFCKVLMSVSIPTGHVWKFTDCTSSPTFGISSLFRFSHFGGYAVLSHCSFKLHFPMTNDDVYAFICILAVYISSLVQCVFSSLPITFFLVYLWLINWWNFLIFCQINILWIFSPISGSPIHFLSGVFWWAVVLNFYEIYHSFSFMVIALCPI